MLHPELLLQAYHTGIFPMSDGRNDKDFYWVRPKVRGVFDFKTFHIPRRLIRFLKNTSFTVKFNTDFSKIIKACADVNNSRRKETWINHIIENAYISLHDMGYAHSVGLYDADDVLCGGLYGVAVSGVFCGESMFSYQTNASKMTLICLMGHLYRQGYELVDAQFYNTHLEQFGLQLISQDSYEKNLKQLLEKNISFIPENNVWINDPKILYDILKNMLK